MKKGGLEFPLVRGDWVDHPRYPKTDLSPLLFFPKNIDFVIFMQFLAIFSKFSSHKSTPFGKPCHMCLFYLKQEFLNKITVLDSIFKSWVAGCFQLFLSNRRFPSRVYIQDTCICIGHMFLVNFFSNWLQS